MAWIIGISGGTGSGKSTLARKLQQVLGEKATILSQDWYYHDLRHLSWEERCSVNFDDPAAVDREALTADIHRLLQGTPVDAPQYDFSRHIRSTVIHPCIPGDFLIVEGLHVISLPVFSEGHGLRIFVDAPDSIRYARRLIRDIQERGRTEESVRRQWEESVLPMHEAHVAPLLHRADVVVTGVGDSTLMAHSIRDMISQ